VNISKTVADTTKVTVDD